MLALLTCTFQCGFFTRNSLISVLPVLTINLVGIRVLVSVLPVLTINLVGVQVVALYDYQAQRSDELSFVQGDSIRVLYKDSDNWWMGELEDGQQGFFPVNYVAGCKAGVYECLCG